MNNNTMTQLLIPLAFAGEIRLAVREKGGLQRSATNE
jgi:hypothetical protein